jgi:two-component system chemotaxis response regulator CheY
MSGLEFLEQAGRRITVVMLTTEGQPELMARAKELGARGWISKPFKPELVIATAKKLVAA